MYVHIKFAPLSEEKSGIKLYAYQGLSRMAHHPKHHQILLVMKALVGCGHALMCREVRRADRSLAAKSDATHDPATSGHQTS